MYIHNQITGGIHVRKTLSVFFCYDIAIDVALPQYVFILIMEKARTTLGCHDSHMRLEVG